MKSKLHPDQKDHHLIILLFFNSKSIFLFCKDILSFIMVLFLNLLKIALSLGIQIIIFWFDDLLHNL